MISRALLFLMFRTHVLMILDR